MKKIRPQHRAFVEYYARTHRAAESAIAAGYGERGARSRATELLKDPDIQALVLERQKELAQEQCVTMDFVLLRALEVLEQCTEGVPHLRWNPETRRKEPDGTWTFDAKGSIQALKLIGELTGSLRTEKSEDGKTEINILAPPGADKGLME